MVFRRLEMKLIEESKKVSIILDDEETVEISTMKGNNTKVVVKCIDNILHVDDLEISNIKNIIEEKNANKALENYLNENQ